VDKNAEQKKRSNEETVSDQEIGSTIRYLDPAAKTRGRNLAVAIYIISNFLDRLHSLCFASPSRTVRLDGGHRISFLKFLERISPFSSNSQFSLPYERNQLPESSCRS
jgi:hypothetical protein